MTKGAASTMVTVVSVLLLLFFFGAYSITLANETNQEAITNLKHADVMRLGNAFNIFNRSLGMTWYISSIQSVYFSLDQSLGCGKDDNNQYDVLPDGYWYRYDKSMAKNINEVNKFMADRDATTATSKYNYLGEYDVQPRICYPLDKDVTDYLQSAFTAFENISKDFTVDSITYHIAQPANSFSLQPNSISSKTRQVVTLTSSSGTIQQTTENNNVIYTELPSVFNATREFLKEMVDLSQSNTDIYAPPIPLPNNINYTNSYTSSNDYLSKMKGNFQFISTALGHDLKNTDVRTQFNTLELNASTSSDNQNIFGDPNVGGLLLHYDVTEQFNEQGAASSLSNVCKQPDSTYANIIESEIAKKEWTFGSLTFSKLEMTAFMEALIQQESSWDQYAVSNCGAAGLTQLMPGTAGQYGLTNLFGNSNSIQCDSAYAGNMKAYLSSLNDQQKTQTDDRLNPQKAIPASVAYVHDLMDEVKNYASDKNTMIKLTAAAYNMGFPNLQAIISVYGSNTIYSTVESQLPDETQNYVPNVFSYYACYGGDVGGLYYFDTGKSFVQRPFSLNVRAEDYIPVIDCRNKVPIPVDPSNPNGLRTGVYAFSQLGDMICCGDVLWSCNADVPNLPANRKLTTNQDIASLKNTDPAAAACARSISHTPNAQDSCFDVTAICNSDGSNTFGITTQPTSC